MKCQIDLKSLLIGVLLAVCIFMAMGASQPSFPHHFGRYQLIPKDDQAWPYVIDSHTGRIWIKRPGRSGFNEMETSTIVSAENNK